MKKDIQNLNTKKTSNTHIKVGVTEKIGLFSRRSRDVKCVFFLTLPFLTKLEEKYKEKLGY